MASSKAAVPNPRYRLPKNFFDLTAVLRDDESLPSYFFTDAHVDVSAGVDGSSLHQPPSWGTASFCGVPMPVAGVQRVSLDQLIASNLCVTCWTGKGFERAASAGRVGYFGRGSGNVVAVVYNIWDMKRRLVRHAERLATTRPPTTQATMRLIAEADKAAAYYSAAVLKSNPELSELISSMVAAASVLKNTIANDGAKMAALMGQIRKAGTPSWWGNGQRSFDETPTLLAVKPAPHIPKKQIIAATALRMFTISDVADGAGPRSSNKLVVAAPRYVVDYLLVIMAQIDLQGNPAAYTQAVVRPDDDRIVEMACALWEPSVPGELQDFLRTIEVATALVGSETPS
jgi:hypothetical protein